MGEHDDAFLDINVRSAGEVGERMMTLAAFIRLATIMNGTDEFDEEDAEAEVADIVEALDVGPLTHVLTVQDRADLFALRTGWEESDILARSWNIEALAALAWSCQLISSLPDPHLQIDARPLVRAIPDPWDDANSFLAGLALRDEDEIAAERERAELWLWRAEIEDERRASAGSVRNELRKTIQEAATEGNQAGLLPSPIDSDFPVGRAGFSSLDGETRAIISEIAAQRLHALNWLCGFGEDWDSVPLDV